MLSIEREPTDLSWFSWVVVADAMVALAMIVWLRSMPWAKRGVPEQVARALRAHLLVAFALSVRPSLVGCVGVFVAGRVTPFLVGSLGSAMLLWLSAPRAAELERIDRLLHARGLSVRALDALGRAGPPDADPASAG